MTHHGDRRSRRRLILGVFFVGGFLVAFSPWPIRNEIQFHQAWPLGTRVDRYSAPVPFYAGYHDWLGTWGTDAEVYPKASWCFFDPTCLPTIGTYPAEAFDGDQNRPYREYVEHDMALLKTCDAIAMLPGWDGPNARGSVWERAVAQLLGLAVYDALAVVAVEIVAPKRQPETALQEAQRLVHGDRGAAYGHPIDDYARTGRMWGAILGIRDIDPRLCCLMMAAVKISREVNAPKRDNRVDLAGYAECAQMVAERQGLK